MKIEYGYDKEKIKRIATNCGSESVKKTYSFLSSLEFYRQKGKIAFFCEFFDDNAFMAYTINKKHIRLYEIAVLKDQQGSGYGRYMLHRLKKIAAQNDINCISFRVEKGSDAVKFYKRNGGKIVGEKGPDYEMKIFF